ncbi:MAG: hypothetical protein GY807_05170 [Gammaproteobacteria bacterium]|nr:hypothetical protein [Gammaproteobacteria bacterium]
MSNDQSRRKVLRGTIKLMILAVFAWLAWIVSGYMTQSSDPARHTGLSIDLKGLVAGDYMIVRWDQRKLYVWHRSDAMLRQLRGYEDRLEDPDSSRSRQPKAATNHYRSLDPHYLVIYARNQDQDCEVEALGTSQSELPVRPWFGGFVDSCQGMYYDLAGRVYTSQGVQRNLEVPAHQILGGNLHLIEEE